MNPAPFATPAADSHHDAASAPPPTAARAESRGKKASGTIAKRACDQCKFRKIKVLSMLLVYIHIYLYKKKNKKKKKKKVCMLNSNSAVCRSHVALASPWALNAPFTSLRRNEAPLDSESRAPAWLTYVV